MPSFLKTKEENEKEAEAIYIQLAGLASAMPDLRAVDALGSLSDASLRWLGELSSALSALGEAIEVSELRILTTLLIRTRGSSDNVQLIKAVLYRALAKAQRLAPTSTQSAFIAIGADFDAFVVIQKIFAESLRSILIVDPYMDATAVTDFAILAKEGVIVALLTDEGGMRDDLPIAANKWVDQYGSSRPLNIRKAARRSLHDRLILVDSDKAWIMTQSLKDFACRSPATIQKVDPALAKMKFEAYSEIWNKSAIVVDRSLIVNLPDSVITNSSIND